MKVGNVTQRVSGGRLPTSPAHSKLDQQDGREPHMRCRKVGCEAGGNKIIGCVIEPRKFDDCGKASQVLKSTLFVLRKTEAQCAIWLAHCAPPGSAIEDGACDHRGGSGTWEIRCVPNGNLQRNGGLHEQSSRCRDLTSGGPSKQRKLNTNKLMSIGYRWASESIARWDDTLEDLAFCSTDLEVK